MNKSRLNEQTKRIIIFIMALSLLVCVFVSFAISIGFATANDNIKSKTTNEYVARRVSSTGTVVQQYTDLRTALVECQLTETVELLKDVTLTGTWAPVDDFIGKFDGKNNTISNLKIQSDTDAIGMFYSLTDAAGSRDPIVKDLTIDKASVSGAQSGIYNVGVLAAYIYGNINNVSITNANVNVPGVEHVGGIAGQTDARIEYCKVSNSTFIGADQVGSLVGYDACAEFNHNTVTDNTIEAKVTRAGGLIGKVNVDQGESGYYSIIGNTISGGSVKAPDMAGGIAGQIMGQFGNYDFDDNNIDVTLVAPKTSPIGVLRENQPTAFTSVLAQNIICNTWTANTYDNETYTYTAAETGCTDQVIYGGPAYPVCKIGETTYTSIQKALEAAQAGQTIVLLKDIELKHNDTTKVSVDINKAGVTLDGAGFTIKQDAGSAWEAYKKDGASKKYGSYNLIIVSADNVTVNNLNVDVADYRGVSCLTTKGGKDVLYSKVTMTGSGSGHYAGVSGSGTITFDNCTISTCGYGINFSNNNNLTNVIINNSTIKGWNSFGVLNNVVARNTYFGTTDDEINKNMAGFRPYCPTYLYNCTFNQDYTKGLEATDYIPDADISRNTYVGIGTGAATTVSFYGCRVDGDLDIQKIINYKNAFNTDAAADGSVFAFDPVQDSITGSYVSGVIQTKAPATTISVAEGSASIPVRAKTGETSQSGEGSLYFVGKNAEGIGTSEVKAITKGNFSVNPSKYIAENCYVKNSEDNDCPYGVTDTEPKTEEKIITYEDTATDYKDIPEEQEETIIEVLVKSDVSGVVTALKGDTATNKEILSAAISAGGDNPVTAEKIEAASNVVYDIKTQIVAEKCVDPTATTGSITFKVSPIATIITTAKDGSITGRAENVAIDNSWLSGNDISVVLGWSANSAPLQVIHTRDNAEKELFTKGESASYDDRKFAYSDSAKTVTVLIRDFSHIKITGTEEIKQLTISDSTVTAKTYDGSNNATIVPGAIAGLAPGAEVDVTATGEYKTADAGKDIEVAVSYKISGKDSENYVAPANETIKGDINKRSVTLTSESATKIYDGTPLTAANVAVSGEGFIVEQGATYDVTGSQTSIGKSENTFTYKLNKNTLEDNYTITTVNGTLEVTGTSSATPTESGIANTGDNTSPLFAILLGACGAIGCALIISRKKNISK